MKIYLPIIALSLFTFSCSQNPKKPGENNKHKMIKEEKLTPTTDADQTTNCHLAKSSRIIEVVKTDQGCELFYTRDGEKISKASSDQGVSHCQKVAQNIQSNLKNAGFSCN